MNTHFTGKQLFLIFCSAALFAFFLGYILPLPRIAIEEQTMPLGAITEFPLVFIFGLIYWHYSVHNPSFLPIVLVFVLGTAVGVGVLGFRNDMSVFFIAGAFLFRTVAALACYQYFVRKIKKEKRWGK